MTQSHATRYAFILGQLRGRVIAGRWRGGDVSHCYALNLEVMARHATARKRLSTTPSAPPYGALCSTHLARSRETRLRVSGRLSYSMLASRRPTVLRAHVTLDVAAF